MNSLVQASVGSTFGQIARGYVDDIRRDLQSVFSGKARSSSLNLAGEVEEEFAPPRRQKLDMLTEYSEPVYALVDPGAIPDIMSDRLTKKLRLEIESTDWSIIAGNEAKVNVQGSDLEIF